MEIVRKVGILGPSVGWRNFHNRAMYMEITVPYSQCTGR